MPPEKPLLSRSDRVTFRSGLRKDAYPEAAARPRTERERRLEAARTVNQMLHDLGRLSALVPRGGALRDQVDDLMDPVSYLAEGIGNWKPGPDEAGLQP